MRCLRQRWRERTEQHPLAPAPLHFLTGERHAGESDRALATVLFADIVGSTERAAQLGDSRWHVLLDSFYGVARRQLQRFRGPVGDARHRYVPSIASTIGSGPLSRPHVNPMPAVFR